MHKLSKRILHLSKQINGRSRKGLSLQQFHVPSVPTESDLSPENLSLSSHTSCPKTQPPCRRQVARRLHGRDLQALGRLPRHQIISLLRGKLLLRRDFRDLHSRRPPPQPPSGLFFFLLKIKKKRKLEIKD